MKIVSIRMFSVSGEAIFCEEKDKLRRLSDPRGGVWSLDAADYFDILASNV